MNSRWRGLLASYFGRFSPEENPLLIEWAGYMPQSGRECFIQEKIESWRHFSHDRHITAWGSLSTRSRVFRSQGLFREPTVFCCRIHAEDGGSRLRRNFGTCLRN